MRIPNSSWTYDSQTVTFRLNPTCCRSHDRIYIMQYIFSHLLLPQENCNNESNLQKVAFDAGRIRKYWQQTPDFKL